MGLSKKTGIVIGVLAGISVIGIGAYVLYKHIKRTTEGSDDNYYPDDDDYVELDEDYDEDLEDVEEEDDIEEDDEKPKTTFAKEVYSKLRFEMIDFEPEFLDLDKTLDSTETDYGIVRVRELKERVAVSIGIHYDIVSNSVTHYKRNKLTIYDLRNYFNELADRCKEFAPDWACGNTYCRFKAYYTESWIYKPKMKKNEDGELEEEWEELDPETGVPQRHYRLVEFSPTVVDPRNDPKYKDEDLTELNNLYFDPSTDEKGLINLKHLQNLLIYYEFFANQLRKRGPIDIDDDQDRVNVRIEESHFGFEINFQKGDVNENGSRFQIGVTPTMIANVLQEIFLAQNEEISTRAGNKVTIYPPQHLLIYEDTDESEVVSEKKLKSGKYALIDTTLIL